MKKILSKLGKVDWEVYAIISIWFIPLVLVWIAPTILDTLYPDDIKAEELQEYVHTLDERPVYNVGDVFLINDVELTLEWKSNSKTRSKYHLYYGEQSYKIEMTEEEFDKAIKQGIITLINIE